MEASGITRGGESEDAGRSKRFIPRPSAQVRERIDRAFKHRMYLLAVHPHRNEDSGGPSANLDILGSTGNVYTVTVGRPCQSCTCVDYTKQPNRVCKHILFVMLRVCKLPQNDPRVWQAALTVAEARPLVESLPSREELASQGDGVLASGAILRGFDQARGEVQPAKQRSIVDEPDCPICFEPLSETGGVDIAWCQSCGHNAHPDCIRRWHAARGGSCPLCRGPWGALEQACTPLERLNLACVAGIQAPSLEELYPETHQWIGFRRHAGEQAENRSLVAVQHGQVSDMVPRSRDLRTLLQRHSCSSKQPVGASIRRVEGGQTTELSPDSRNSIADAFLACDQLALDERVPGSDCTVNVEEHCEHSRKVGNDVDVSVGAPAKIVGETCRPLDDRSNGGCFSLPPGISGKPMLWRRGLLSKSLHSVQLDSALDDTFARPARHLKQPVMDLS